MTTRRPRLVGLGRLFGTLLAWGLSLLAASWRVEGAELVRLEIEKRNGTPVLLGFWHGKYFPLLVLLRGIRGHVFVGESLRGTLIGGICESFGFSPVLLPHHDRRRALARMRAALAGPLPCATPFDGPLGPPHRVKTPLLELAAECGATILPLSVSAKPCLVLRWRWDRREIPWPFARVILRIGEPIQVPIGLPPHATRSEWCEGVRTALDALDGASTFAPRHP